MLLHKLLYYCSKKVYLLYYQSKSHYGLGGMETGGPVVGSPVLGIGECVGLRGLFDDYFAGSAVGVTYYYEAVGGFFNLLTLEVVVAFDFCIFGQFNRAYT